MTGIELIRQELVSLGYAAVTTQFPNFTVDNGRAVVFEYEVDSGSHRGKHYRMAVSFQEAGYPEYPPHFIHIYNAPQLQLTAHSTHDEGQGKWSAFSVPPSDFWDHLPVEHKNMNTYINRHMRRLWASA